MVQNGKILFAIILAASGCVFAPVCLAAQCPPLMLNQTLYDPDPKNTSEFGSAVAASEHFALVGEWHDQSLTYDGEGSASLFNIATGAFIRKIHNPTPATFDYFGWAVALTDNYAVVGAYRDDTDGGATGIAYLFDIATGALLQTFNNPTPAKVEEFGYAVAISGNNVLVGAPYAISISGNAGIAYIFDAVSGTLLQTLNGPLSGTEGFGMAVAIDGNNALVGAPSTIIGLKPIGTAYLFDAGTGSLLQTLNNPHPDSGTEFGGSVAISGNNVLVGAPDDDTGSTNTGSAYLFDAVTGSLLHTFNDPSLVVNDHFSSSISISGNNILVGAPDDDTDFNNSGMVYLFDAATGDLLQRIHNPGPALADLYGSTVSISGNNVIAGAPDNFDKGQEAGVAYIFGCPPPTPTPIPTASPTPFDNAIYISDTLPNQLPIGQAIEFGVSIKNTGNTTWTGAGGYLLGLISDSCGIFQSNRFPVPDGVSVAPNQTIQFILYVTAPANPSSCSFSLNMYQDGGAGFFGGLVSKTLIIVSPPPNAAKDWTVYE